MDFLGPVISGMFGLINGAGRNDSAEDIANMRAQSEREALEERRRQFNLTRGDKAPWRNVGQQAHNELAKMMGLVPNYSFAWEMLGKKPTEYPGDAGQRTWMNPLVQGGDKWNWWKQDPKWMRGRTDAGYGRQGAAPTMVGGQRPYGNDNRSFDGGKYGSEPGGGSTPMPTSTTPPPAPTPTTTGGDGEWTPYTDDQPVDNSPQIEAGIRALLGYDKLYGEAKPGEFLYQDHLGKDRHAPSYQDMGGWLSSLWGMGLSGNTWLQYRPLADAEGKSEIWEPADMYQHWAQQNGYLN